MTTMTDSQLGGMMQLVRGTHWYVGMFDDPYARLLRGQDDDPTPYYAAARERGMYQNLLGTWVVADYELARQVLADARFDVRKADGTQVPQHVLPLENSYLGLSVAERQALEVPSLEKTVVEAACERALGKKEFDLVGDFAMPVAVDVFAELLGVSDRETFAKHCAAISIARDAELCPQRLADARALITALDGLNEQLHNDAAAVLLAVQGVQGAVSLIVNTVLNGSDVAETLRVDPPVHIHGLVAHTDVEIGGNTVAADSQLVVLLAGHDEPLAPQGEIAAPLIRVVAETAVSALSATQVGPVLRRRRTPVTRSVIRAAVTA